MQDTNLDLSKTIESVEKNRESTTSGFENIGKFYKHFRKESKAHKELKAIHQSIYMILVEYSFGYTKNIKLEISISIKQLMNECGASNKTIINAMKVLLDSGLIERIAWQQVGPKQIYKYRVVFPEGYNIVFKNISDNSKCMSKKNNEIKGLL